MSQQNPDAESAALLRAENARLRRLLETHRIREERTPSAVARETAPRTTDEKVALQLIGGESGMVGRACGASRPLAALGAASQRQGRLRRPCPNPRHRGFA